MITNRSEYFQEVFMKMSKSPNPLKKTIGEDLDLDYGILFPKTVADLLFRYLEDSVEYYKGELTKVKVFGKVHEIPRQQVAYGDEGLTYTFSGLTIPAKSWTAVLNDLRNMLGSITGHNYNFVLINRYRSGKDHIGEHRDAEKDLDRNTPIASISLGQQRKFILKHGKSRGKNKRDIPPVKLLLEHGSVLLMNPPTNDVWYHSLPPAKTAPGVRINLTFRRIVL